MGSSALSSGIERAFVWDSGVMTDLGSAAGTWSRATAIAPDGRIAGIAGPGERSYGRRYEVWDRGEVQDLGAASSDAPAIRRISDETIIGQSESTYERHVYVWQNGTSQDLGGFSAAVETYIGGINARGVLVGSSRHHQISSVTSRFLTSGVEPVSKPCPCFPPRRTAMSETTRIRPSVPTAAPWTSMTPG